jgi:hypothetical protein
MTNARWLVATVLAVAVRANGQALYPEDAQQPVQPMAPAPEFRPTPPPLTPPPVQKSVQSQTQQPSAPPPSASPEERVTSQGYIRVEPGQPAYDPPQAAEQDEDEALLGDQTPEGAATVDFQTFHDALSPYGQWIYTADNGWIWQPSGESEDWTPYSDGEWQWTAYGWTWCGAEPWAWGPYHYGRWTQLNGIGWGWVPGYTWRPAWVAWRNGPGYVGWTPLRPGWGYGGWGGWPIAYNNWNFTPLNHFYGESLRGHLIGGSAVAGVWGLTNFSSSFRYNGAAFLGPHPGIVASAIGHAVTPLTIHPITSLASARLAGVHGGTLNVVAPTFFSASHPFSAHGQPVDVAANAALGNRLAEANQAHPAGTVPFRGELPGSNAAASRVVASGEGGSFSTYHAPSVSNGYGSYAPYRGPTSVHASSYAGGYHPQSYSAPHYGGGSYGGPRYGGFSGGYHAPSYSAPHPGGGSVHSSSRPSVSGGGGRGGGGRR